jgi:hypothetical protein
MSRGRLLRRYQQSIQTNISEMCHQTSISAVNQMLMFRISIGKFEFLLTGYLDGYLDGLCRLLARCQHLLLRRMAHKTW